MNNIEAIIASHPFWQGLRAEFLPLAAESARLSCYGLGDLIFHERQNAEHLYLVHKGQVALEAFLPGKGVTTLQLLGPGEALGWSWLFPPYRWQFSARSVDATQIIEFGAACLRAKAEEHPAFGRELVTRMAQVLLQRLQATRMKLQEFHDPGVGRHLAEHLGDADDECEPVNDPLR